MQIYYQTASTISGIFMLISLFQNKSLEAQIYAFLGFLGFAILAKLEDLSKPEEDDG